MISITVDNKLYQVGTNTFSKSANDELLKSAGLYQYWKTTIYSIIWDTEFVKRLDAYIAETYTENLNPSEYKTIQDFLNYEEAMHAGTGTINPVYEALDELLALTSLNGGY
jgi:hypothetical protein